MSLKQQIEKLKEIIEAEPENVAALRELYEKQSTLINGYKELLEDLECKVISTAKADINNEVYKCYDTDEDELERLNMELNEKCYELYLHTAEIFIGRKNRVGLIGYERQLHDELGKKMNKKD